MKKTSTLKTIISVFLAVVFSAFASLTVLADYMYDPDDKVGYFSSFEELKQLIADKPDADHYELNLESNVYRMTIEESITIPNNVDFGMIFVDIPENVKLTVAKGAALYGVWEMTVNGTLECLGTKGAQVNISALLTNNGHIVTNGSSILLGVNVSGSDYSGSGTFSEKAVVCVPSFVDSFEYLKSATEKANDMPKNILWMFENFDELEFTGDLTIPENVSLNVGGCNIPENVSVVIKGDAEIYGDLTVDGKLRAEGKLKVEGDVKGGSKDIYVRELEAKSIEAEINFIKDTDKGDCNGDGTVDNKDIVVLFRCVSGSAEVTVEMYVLDYNDDGSVDNKDVVALFRALSSK